MNSSSILRIMLEPNRGLWHNEPHMMKPLFLLTVKLAALSLLLCSCSHPLESESGLYKVELRKSYKVALDGYWITPDNHIEKRTRKGTIYIAPLDVSLVEKDEPELSKLIDTQMHGLFVEEMQKMLVEGNAANKSDWRLTNDPHHANIRVDIAVVRLRPQNPVMRILGTIGSFFSPVPGTGTVVDTLTEGDICIEATVRDGRTGELLFAMKDSNRTKTKLYRAEAYKKGGNIDANMHAWARKLAFLFRNCTADRLGNRTLKQAIEERSFINATRAHMGL